MAIDTLPVIPKVGVSINATEIRKARELAQTETWAKAKAEEILAEATKWAEKPDSWYQEIVPPRNSMFAYGISGCPLDQASWSPFGRNCIADFSRPLTLQCPQGHIIEFDDQRSPYYDNGDGLLINGVRYWLRGVWNSYVVEQLAGWGDEKGAIYALTYAYALTGDPKYAHKALIIMDALATVSPTTSGPRDFTSNLNINQGRLHWLTSIVHRAKLDLVRAYDLLYHSMDVMEPSPTNPGRTLKENIEAGLLVDYLFDTFDIRNGRLHNLQNHEADSVRGMLAVGLVLGNPEWITWGINDIAAFLENTIDRDGIYYETTYKYARFADQLFMSMADMAYRYSPDNYEGDGFPARSSFPYQANYYDHPKLRKFLIGRRERIDAAGFEPTIGDGGSNVGNNLAHVLDRSLERNELQALAVLATRCSDPVERSRYTQMLLEATHGDLYSFRSGYEALFATFELPAVQPTQNKAETNTSASNLLGGTVTAYLRSGTGTQQRAAVLRGGPTLTHGHDDPLSLYLFAKGYDLSVDIGYGLAGSPVHWGWGVRSISHNLVVVNKGMSRNDIHYHVGPGADTLAFARQAGLSGVEMDARLMFDPSDGVSQYQRGVWQVDVSASDSYWIDIFRITGGNTHDYSFHSAGAIVELEGTPDDAIPGVWTLHGLDEPQATFNAPQRSWGERIIPGEAVKDLGLAGEKVRSRYWAPPPGNGYGFIYDVKGGQPAGDWSGTWTLADTTDTKLRLTMLAEGGAHAVYKGLGPNRSGKEQYAYVIARREGTTSESLKSRFVSIIQAYEGQPIVTRINELPRHVGADQSVALRLELADGTIDYVLSNPQPGMDVQAYDTQTLLATDALFALIRVRDGEVVKWHMVGGTGLKYGSWQVTASVADYSGVVESIDYADCCFTTSAPIPSSVIGSTLLLDDIGYTRNTAYEVKGVEQLPDGRCLVSLGDTTLELASTGIKSIVDQALLELTVPLPTGHNQNIDTGVLHGKYVFNVRTQTGCTINKVKDMSAIYAEIPSDWRVGDPLRIYDVKTGDTFRILHQACGVGE
jgi:hypothetical protein